VIFSTHPGSRRLNGGAQLRQRVHDADRTKRFASGMASSLVAHQ